MADPYKYDPGSPSIAEDIQLDLVEGKPRPWDMGYGFISDDQFAEMVIEKINEDDLIQNAREHEEAGRYD